MNRRLIRSAVAVIGLTLVHSLHADLSLPMPKPAKFRAQTIDDQIQIGYGLAIADVDGDGRQDILLADKEAIVWYQNPTWKKHVMTGHLTEKDHVCIAARDIDGDGKAEVAVGAEWNPGDTVNSGAVFYLVAPEDRTREWEAIRLPHEPTTHRMLWVQDKNEEFYLAVLPLHGKGNQNGDGEGVRMMGYRPPADPHEKWETFEINGDLHMTHNFDPVRWDSEDAEEEMLIASREGVTVVGKVKGEWASLRVTPQAAGEVRSGKLPSGRRFIASIEPMHGNELVVNTPSLTLTGQLYWDGNRVVLDDSLLQGHALANGDFLGLGWDQIIVGSRGNGRPGDAFGIKMFVPVHKRGHEWKLHTVIDDNQMACEDLKLADLNGDGKLDIVASGRATKNVVIYWNETP